MGIVLDATDNYGYSYYIRQQHTLHRKRKMKTTKKTTWIVKKDGIEIIRVKTKREASRIAELMGATFHAYTVEWVK